MSSSSPARTPATSPPVFRRARSEDLPAIIGLLADDELGAGREAPGDPVYRAAFEDIDADPRQLLVVADLGGEVVGTLQLTLISGLSRRAATRAQIEAVRVREDQRGGGVGRALLEWALDQARQRGAVLAQLTTDVRRVDALRFYERLGFQASHHGLKLPLI
ncbi:GNAT family N-acetyltransferase [Actinoalloteichus caeruleus]|uniref:GNAT family N-acetyltransferase n=1 Tax=Actinoalloteichus cyanogriseus TaxID=2893586 RepID=UPI00068AE6C0|nr:GNAT family N-acetyltransferase [Actinoalloteichus caeruleus]